MLIARTPEVIPGFRALRLGSGPRGRWFESSRPDQKFRKRPGAIPAFLIFRRRNDREGEGADVASRLLRYAPVTPDRQSDERNHRHLGRADAATAAGVHKGTD